ncbi:unnamed protein product [Camellia sinensis]
MYRAPIFPHKVSSTDYLLVRSAKGKLSIRWIDRLDVVGQQELPHPGGPLTTNKAAALVKFLERKLQEPNGLASIKPKLVERAVKNAKDIIKFMTYKPYIHDPTHDLIFLRRVFPVGLYGLDLVGRIVRHVDSFGDYEVVYFCVPVIIFGKASINRCSSKDIADAVVKRPKKKLKL